MRQMLLNTSRREGCISADTFRFISKNCLTLISHLRWLFFPPLVSYSTTFATV